MLFLCHCKPISYITRNIHDWHDIQVKKSMNHSKKMSTTARVMQVMCTGLQASAYIMRKTSQSKNVNAPYNYFWRSPQWKFFQWII